MTTPTTRAGAGDTARAAPEPPSTFTPPEPLPATPPIELPPERGYRWKRRLLGEPLHTEQLEHERLGKPTALAVFASDNLSSSAYATEEILHVLVPAVGVAAFSLVVPITLAMLVVLAFLILSYRETIKAYPKGASAYLVVKDNFGPGLAQVAGAALLTDYVLTVAVSTSAGTAALVSAAHALEPYRILIALGFIGLIMFGNLRGLRESGRLFGIPTYFFMLNVAVLLGLGMVKWMTGELVRVGRELEGMVEFGTEGEGILLGASLFVVLHAFASGGAAVTGIEAISDGVPAFRKPEWRNARQTLVLMGVGLGVMFLGLSFLASRVEVAPYESGTPTVIAQIGEAVYGHGVVGDVLFYSLQAGTMLILVLAANTGFADFPRLASFQAGDRFLPRQLTIRGHRLVYSNGILALAGAAAVLVVVTGAKVTNLIPLYAVGVFTSFTLSQASMTRRHLRRREPGWRKGIAVNGFGGVLSFVVAVIVAVTKFPDGAWAILVALPILVVLLLRVHRQYEVERMHLEEDVPKAVVAPILRRHVVLVFVDKLDLATARAIQYARALTPDELRAVHFALDPAEADELQAAWAAAGMSRVTLELVDCPDRRLTRAAVELVARDLADGDTEVSVLLPDRKYTGLWHRILHDRTADAIERAVSQLAHANVTTVPFHFGRGDGAKPARRKVGPRPRARRGAPVTGDGPAPPAVPRADGTTPIGSVRWRQRVAIQGEITTVRVEPVAGSWLLECVVSDGTGVLSLVFNGRRQIPGMELGAHVRAEATVASHRGRLAMFNPVYALVVPQG
ncbi:MAG TPA: amino acid permease [Acidimicrobiales bacterium]